MALLGKKLYGPISQSNGSPTADGDTKPGESERTMELVNRLFAPLGSNRKKGAVVLDKFMVLRGPRSLL